MSDELHPSESPGWRNRFKDALGKLRKRGAASESSGEQFDESSLADPAGAEPAPDSGDALDFVDATPKATWRERLSALVPANLANRLPSTLEPVAIAEWVSQTVQRQGFGFYGKLLTILLCSYFLADVAAILLGRYIPEPPPARSMRTSTARTRMATLGDYNIIMARNLFNSRGIIPGEDSNGFQDLGGAPVRTSLPLNLVGTVVLENPASSVATIDDKSANQVYPVRQDDEIPGKARIVAIEPRRVVFVNLQSGRREYVELPEEAGSSPRITVGGRGAGAGGGGGIEQVSATQFNVQRSEVDKALANLNQVLTQARAVPNFENGVPAGYKLFQIVPGSIYDKLGLQNGDTLTGLNGQMVDNPGKAFEMLNELKTSNYLELSVKRGGKTVTFSYNIN